MSDRRPPLALRYHIGDAFELLADLDDASIDLTVTDPPYESLERHRVTATGRPRGTTARLSESKGSSNPWFGVLANADAPRLFAELYRVHRPRSHAYVLCDEPTAEVYKAAARDAGFWVWKSLIWVKVKADGSPRLGMGYHWRNATERILFIEKRTRRQVEHAAWSVRLDPTGKGRQLRRRGWGDVLAFEPIRGRGASAPYPTEKPVPLLARLVENSSAPAALADAGTPADVVLDPFAGSGSTGWAARALGRRFVLGDVNPAARELWP